MTCEIVKFGSLMRVHRHILTTPMLMRIRMRSGPESLTFMRKRNVFWGNKKAESASLMSKDFAYSMWCEFTSASVSEIAHSRLVAVLV